MSVRKSALDAATAEAARRRLSQLGAELTQAAPPQPPPESPPSVPGPGRTEDVVEGAVEGAGEGAGAVPDGARTPAPAGRTRGGRHAGARPTRLGRGLGRVVDRAADALPPTLQSQMGVTAQHVTVVALVLAAAMGLAAWLVVRSAPDPVAPRHASLLLPRARGAPAPMASVSPPATVGPAVPSVPSPAVATAPAELFVHVIGKVRRPGVVELPSGSRVIDAVEAAGGARRGARLGSLNLARLLVDGEQIAVGVPAAVVPPPVGVPAAPVASGAPTAPVNINTATQAELEELPDVGPVTATSIIAWRTEHGGFSTVDELLEVSGIGDVTLADLRDLVTV